MKRIKEIPMQKLGLKDKIKNFFTIPDEVFEEEPSPEFGKQKLFTLTKNKLFFGILAFLMLVNILVFLNLNQFYIRAVLAFLFIVTIPGLLIMLMLKIREVGFWEYLVYVVGLSVSFIMFGGLAVNWILPWLNITDKPLSLYPILICFNIFLIAFWITAWIRNKDFKPLKIQYPKLDTINRIFFVVPMLFPVLAILGAFLLNNHGTNILTMIMLGGIAVYVLLLTIYRKKLDKNIWPWAIWMIGLSLLLMYGLRCWHIFGYDIHREFRIFDITLDKGFWDFNNFKNNYSSCLSISILPLVLFYLINMNKEFIFKLIFPLLFSLAPLLVYLITIKQIKNKLYSFFASFFFISFVWFIDPIILMARQEIAYIFFGLMLLILFDKKISSLLKKIMIIILGFSMIVSHYSTSYIVLAMFIGAYIFFQIYRLYNHIKINDRNKKPNEVQYSITIIFVLLLLVFGFLWYSQVTPISDSAISVSKDTISNFNNILSWELKTDILRKIVTVDSVTTSKADIDNYIQNLTNEMQFQNNFNTYDLNKSGNLELSPRYNPFTDNINYNLLSIFNKFYKADLLLIEIFLILGAFIFLVNVTRKKGSFNLEYIIFLLLFVIFGALIFLIPKLSIYYGFDRLYVQSSFITSLIAVIGGVSFFRIDKPKLGKILFIITIIIFFLFNYGFLWQISGGKAVFWLNNGGYFYDVTYFHNQEVSSSEWLSSDGDFNGNKIYADSPSSPKIKGINNFDPPISRYIFPSTISRNSYVYLSNTHVIEGVGFFEYKLSPITYGFPTVFLEDNKNKVYNNGGSVIFK